MLIKIESLKNHLSKNISKVYVISSDEQLLLLEAADCIRKFAISYGYTDRKTFYIDKNFKWEQLNLISSENSLFGDKKIIDLRFFSGQINNSGTEFLLGYLNKLQFIDNAIMLISLPKLNWKMKNSNWIISLQKNAIFIEIPSIERSGLKKWIVQRMSLQNQTLDDSGIEYLNTQLEGNLLAANQEIIKLGLIYPKKKLSLKEIKSAVLSVARYDVYNLSEAILSNDKTRLTKMIYGLKNEGEPLPIVLWVIIQEIRMLIEFKNGILKGENIHYLFKNLKIWGSKQKLVQNSMKKIKVEKLEKILKDFAQIDRIVKGLQSNKFVGGSWEEIINLSIKIF